MARAGAPADAIAWELTPEARIDATFIVQNEKNELNTAILQIK